MTTDPLPVVDPVAEYKRLVGLAHAAARDHRELETKQISELTKEILAANEAITAARKEEKKVEAETKDWWAEKTTGLELADWLGSDRPLKPDLTADPARVKEQMGRVIPATAAFQAALRRAIWPRKSL